MADKTKYYYLKIKENFFDSEDMKLLESMDNGYIYSNILMKMYLLSLKNGGKLMYKDKIPYNSKMLSTILNHNVDILDKAISIFKELNLIEILDSGAIFMLDIQNYIGKSSDEADRIREYRNKINTERKELLQMYDKSMTNLSNIKDKDKDIIKDIDIDIVIDREEQTTKNTIFDFIEKNFGRTLSLIEYEEISKWEDNELTRYAIKQSILNGKYNIKYISRILENYSKSNIKTIQQAKKQEEKYKKGNKEKTTEWLGKEINVSEATKEEQEEIEGLLKEYK